MLRSYSKCVRFTPGLSRCLLFLKTTICYTRKNKRHHRGLISLLFSTREFSRVAVVALVGASDFFSILRFGLYCHTHRQIFILCIEVIFHFMFSLPCLSSETERQEVVQECT